MTKISRMIAFGLLALAATPAFAMTMPELATGMCPIDSRQDADRNALTLMHLTTQTEADMKALFAECSELEAVRMAKLKFISRYGNLLVERNTLPEGVTPKAAIQLVTDAAGLSGAVSSQMVRIATGNLGESRFDKITPPSMHTVLKKSDRYVVLGSEQRHVIPGQQQYAAAAVSVITVVENHFVVINFYAPFTGTEAGMKALGQQAETYAQALLAANP